MLKRVLHIATVLWLINALVCFHPVFSENSIDYTHSVSKGDPENTLLDIVYNLITGNKDTGEDVNEGPSNKTRYLAARSVSISVVIAVSVIFYLVSNLVTILPALKWRVWIKKVFLPPHHHFLFRLSPF